jgi:putative ABC transport system permease protein
MDTLISDIRFALRGLVRSPSFALTAVLALGLGIGSTAGVFSLLEGVVLRPLPYRAPDRLVTIWDTNRDKALTHEPLSPVNFGDYRALTTVFEDAAAWWRPQLNLADETGDPVRVSAVETSENLFDVLGVQPAIGRSFTVHPDLFGPEHEAIISHRLWQTRFGGATGVIGRAVRLNGFPYTVVGVMPPGFGFPGETDLWQQLQWDLRNHSRGAHFMESVARLRPGVTPERADRELAALGARLGSEFRATNDGWTPRVIPLDRETAGVFRPALFALFGASALLLLIACINVANLLLARASARRREVALRAAIGASRGRLVRLFLTESVVLAAAGALVGLGVAILSVKALIAGSPVAIPRADAIGVDAPVLIFATVVAALTALTFGLVPALVMSRAELQDALKDGSKGSGSHGRAIRSTLVVAEVALAVVLLSGAGLLVRSVGEMLRVNTGVDPASVITADVQLPDAAYREWERVDQFYTSLARALSERPEIVAAGSTTFLPLEPGWRLPFLVAGSAPVPSGDEPTAQVHSADAGYFAALRVPIVRGRTFDAHDDAGSAPIVIVNEALAKQLWPGEDPIGKRLITRIRNIGPLGRRIVPGDEHEVVGVVRDIRNSSLREAPEPAIYFSDRQFPSRKMHVVVRGRSDPAALTALVREEVRRLDPSLPLGDVRPMSRVLAEVVDPPRFVMMLMTAFAAIALALAAVGIYGMLSYAVSHRRREFGIRLALGARPSGVLRLIVREGLTLALAGCAIGLAGTYVAGRSLAGFLFEVKPWDPATLAVVLSVVIGVAALACVIPGRRASAEDPAGALRSDS